MKFELTPFSPIAAGVYTAVAEPASVTIGLVVGERAAMLIDTGSSPSQGAAILEGARTVAGDIPITHAVITHAHFDHFFGIAGLPGLDTIGHRGLAAVRPAAEQLAALGVSDADVTPPQHTFGLATTVDLGGCHVEIVHFGRGHTDHDAVVLVPCRNVVFVGDLLESDGAPWCGDDSWPAHWPKTLDGMLGTLNARSIVVPGHGALMSREDAFLQRAEIAWYGGKAEELYDAGAAATGAWTADGEWPWPQAQSEAFLAVAMRRLGQSGRPRRRILRLLP